MKLCKHATYKVIDDIWSPRYSTGDVLINVNKIMPNVEHYLIKFSKAPSYPDWLYFSGKEIRKCKTQKNGSGSVYVVRMSTAQSFEPLKQCEHDL